MAGSPGNVSRRRLLGGGLLLAAAYVSAHALGHRPLPERPSAVLGSGPRRTLEAAFRALLPRDEDALFAAEAVDRFLAEGDPIDAEQLRLALLVLEHLGGLGPLRFQRFSRLDAAEQAEVLESWRTSPLGLKRQVYQGLRKAALFTHYSRPEIWPAIGYDGPWVRR